MEGKNIAYLDVVRVLACLMVVMMHAPLPYSGAHSLFLLSVSYLTAPCIGLFFMVSGALLLPVRDDALTFLRKRLLKVLLPAVVWSFVYVGAGMIFDGSSPDLLRVLLSVPFTAQGHGVLWFVYVLIGLYLIAPVISPWLRQCGRRVLEVYLLVWAFTMCFPILRDYISVDGGVFTYVSGYAGYFVLGYYMSRYSDAKSLRVLSLLMVPAIVVPVWYEFNGHTVDFYSYFGYLSIFVAIMSAFWFGVCKVFTPDSASSCKWLSLASRLSFGVYLCHILIMRRMVWFVEQILLIDNYPLQCVAIFLVTLALSYLLTFLLSLLPFGKYIVGFSFRRK